MDESAAGCSHGSALGDLKPGQGMGVGVEHPATSVALPCMLRLAKSSAIIQVRPLRMTNGYKPRPNDIRDLPVILLRGLMRRKVIHSGITDTCILGVDLQRLVASALLSPS